MFEKIQLEYIESVASTCTQRVSFKVSEDTLKTLRVKTLEYDCYENQQCKSNHHCLLIHQ